MSKPIPQVSIGMPVYNGEPFIREALDSLLAQTFTDFELIISDNASTDDTEAICREYAAKDPRVRYVQKTENKGAVANFQFVLDEAVGEYFMWAAADDMWDSQWIEKLLPNIKADTIGVVGQLVTINSSFLIMPQNQEARVLTAFEKGSHIQFFYEDESRAKCHYIYALFKKKYLANNPISDIAEIKYWGDAIFVNKILRLGGLECIPTTTRYARSHNANSGRTAWNEFYGWSRVIWKVHPFAYYKQNSQLVPYPRRYFFYLIAFIKHLRDQGCVWFRGAKAICLNPKHFAKRINELNLK